MKEILLKEKEKIEKRLEVFKDTNFLFDEPSHTYTYSGKKFDSVTTFLKNFKEPFQRDYWVREKARQRGVDPSVIENEWKEKADKSTVLGTNVHKWIEDFWTGLNPEMPEPEEEIERVLKFKELYEQKFKDLVPLPSEPFLMWDEKRNKILILIGDWKTNKEFKHDDHPKGRYKKLLRPFHTLYENQHNEYSIQLSMYRLILEESIGLETESGFLVHIGPDGPARIFPARDLRAPLRAYLDQNRAEPDIFDIE